MKIKQSFLYQLNDGRKSITIYYIVIACILLMNILLATVSIIINGESNVSMSGLNMITVFFLFVFGLSFFKDNFRMLIQNGISRKTLFIGAVLSMLAIAFGMAIIDGIVSILFALISLMFGGSGAIMDNLMFGYLTEMSGVAIFFIGLLNAILANFIALCLGYLIVLIFYRLPKGWKTLVSITVPVFLILVLPIIDMMYFGTTLILRIWNFFFTILTIPITNFWWFFATAIVCLVCSFLLARKAIIKQK